MVYERKMVVVVEQGGRVLREHDGVVRLPFGSDYGLRLKNLNSRRAVVSVSVDGEDVLGSNRIVVEPNAETRLDGFMDQSGHVRRRFRFTQKTKEVVEHRGDRLDDGTVRIEFRYECPEPEVRRVDTIYRYHDHDWPRWPRPYWPQPCWPQPYWPNQWWGSPFTWTSASGGLVQTTAGVCGQTACSAKSAVAITNTAGPLNDEGITVRGAGADQSFQSASVGELEDNSTVIVLLLRGTNQVGNPVKQAVTTRQKVRCPTCGRDSKSSAEYCAGCGTALIA